jgi:hypothetical protein
MPIVDFYEKKEMVIKIDAQNDISSVWTETEKKLKESKVIGK